MISNKRSAYRPHRTPAPLVAVLTLFLPLAGASLEAQEVQPANAASTSSSPSAEGAIPEVALPAPVRAAAEPPAQAATDLAATLAPGVVPAGDAVLGRVREKLADAAKAAGAREDRVALAAFYRDQQAALWVHDQGPSPRGQSVMAEIAKSADWGLAAGDFALPPAAVAGTEAAAEAEIAIGLAVLKYARHARGGRLDPASLSRFFDQKPALKAPQAVLAEIAAAPAADAYLRQLHPRHPQFEMLRQALLKARAGAPLPAAGVVGDPTVKVVDGPTVKPGQMHASVADLRRRLAVTVEDAGKANVLDAKLVEALKAFQTEADVPVNGTLDKATRSALNKSRKAEPPGSEVQRILANMERWRWVPEEMGAFHVWDNIPEQLARVIKNNQVVHQARIVVGKLETQTPLFSADMRYIVFHPGWGVPDSIKVKELLPHLRPTQSFFGFGETDTAVLRRHGLTVNLNGKPVDPAAINWQQVDIRRYSFVQPPGASNVLGVLKFRFPNKHDVYMHDTSQRDLFQRGQRTFSHGCVRVENPQRLAEVLLDHDRGMPASEVARLLASGPKDNQIELKAKIPVHITYFTAVAQPDGSIKTFADFYGHDARVTAALAGRPMALERGSEVAEAPRRGTKPVRQAKAGSGGSDFFSGLFGN